MLTMPTQDPETKSEPTGSPPLRLRQPIRNQVTPVPAYLEDVLPADHLARLIWHAVGLLELTPFAGHLVVTVDGPGRAAAAPRLLVTLWLYAFSQGVSSARELARLCVRDLAYIWLCGGVTMNYHTLSDFRLDYQEALEQLMTEVLGRLLHAGLVKLEHVAQDGMRVRASAGAASFRRQPSLEKCLAQAQQFLASLPEEDKTDAEDEDDEDKRSRGQRRAARERAARERVARLEAALGEMPAVRESKRTAEEREQARVSSTDPEARVMKMPDGGFRPAYNFQFAVDTAERVIVGVDVSNVGSDMEQMPPMAQQVERRCAALPDDWLMDGGFASKKAIEVGTVKGMRVLAPVQKPKKEDRDPHVPLSGDSPAVAAWRKQMGTPEAKETYKLRAATVELVNAQARCRHGLQQLRVRGRLKALCIALWVAITHNLLIWLRHLVGQGALPVAAAA
jgi:transposase